jgi:hypothetical protein
MKTKRWTHKDLALLEERRNLISKSNDIQLFDNNAFEIVTPYELMIQVYKKSKGLFFPGNIPSLKNSREIIQVPTKQSLCCQAGMIKLGDTWKCSSCMKPARRKMIPKLDYSSTVKKYISHTKPIWLKNKEAFKQLFNTEKMCIVGLYFIRDSKRMFDYHNAEQIIGDLMAQYGYIHDDNTKHLKIIPIGHHVNTSHAGMLMFNLDSFDDIIYSIFKTQVKYSNMSKQEIIDSHKEDIAVYEKLIRMVNQKPTVVDQLKELIDSLKLEIRDLSQI